MDIGLVHRTVWLFTPQLLLVLIAPTQGRMARLSWLGWLVTYRELPVKNLIYYMLYTHFKSFTVVKNRKCGQVTSHCRKARLYRADLSLFLNVPVVTVKPEITVWGRLFQTVGDAWQKACLPWCTYHDWVYPRSKMRTPIVISISSVHFPFFQTCCSWACELVT